jgi:signal transduction histidine kinase
MAPAQRSDPPRPSDDRGPSIDRDELLHGTLAGVMRACDIVFGTTSVVLAVVGIWLYVLGKVHLLTVAALWSIPVFNSAWSALTQRRDRVTADLLRGLVCLPISVFLYVGETGVYARLWIPALLMSVGIAISVGIASRRTVLGQVVTFSYAGALFGAGLVYSGGGDLDLVEDALAIVLTGGVMSFVAAKLGRTLDEARRQRDSAHEQKDRAEAVLQQLTERSRELTTAIASLHHEMEHRMRVEVDTGTGIPEDVRGHIFDPFFTTKPVGRGSGQGLAIARSVIVDKHRGQLDFETEVGKGTTFVIRLPIDGPVRAGEPDAVAIAVSSSDAPPEHRLS